MMKKSNGFETELSQLSREELPAEWRNTVLGGVTSELESGLARRPLFGPFMKTGVGAIAACWMAIGVFAMVTPKADEAEQLADRFGIELEQVPMLAQRFGGDAVSVALLETLNL